MEGDEVAGSLASSSGNSSTQREVEWNRLPPEALERIFSFLAHKDRTKASQVCKVWNEVYDSPCLWSSPVFKFTKNQHSRPKFNPRYAINKYGRFFRKLTILYNRPGCRSRKFMTKQVSEFLRCLVQEGIQVSSIRMPRLMILVELGMRRFTCSLMADFLKIQTGLTRVDFTDGRTLQITGMNLLENVQPANVQHLMLQNFFESNFSGITREPRYLRAIERFTALRTLSINYNYLSNGVMTCLSNNLNGNLEVFSILCKKCESISHKISNESWTSLKRKCPNMRVDFKLVSGNLRTTFIIESLYLSPRMPLYSFYFSLNNRWTPSYDHVIFNYLSDTYSDTLRDVEFVLMGRDCGDVRTGLIEVLKKCPMLENLSIRMRFPYFKMKQLFDSVLETLTEQMMEENTLSLKVFRATFRGLFNHARNEGKELNETYKTKFSEIGIHFKLRFK